MVMSESVYLPQSLLDVIDENGRDFGVTLILEQSKIMIVYMSDDERNAMWRLAVNE